MSINSPIEWTMITWNFLVGCTKKSKGCMNCYAIKVAWRLMHNPNPKIARKYEGTVAKDSSGKLNWTGRINFDAETLALPLNLKEPQRIFVNSVSDLFHPKVKPEWIAAAFAVMMATPHHTYQVLTKHPDRAARWFRDIDGISAQRGETPREMIEDAGLQFVEACHLQADLCEAWPLPNVHILTSVEDQPSADERIPWLLRIPAAVRGISAEPLLGPIDLSLGNMIGGAECNCGDFVVGDHGPYGKDACRVCRCAGVKAPWKRDANRRLDWVVVGGESGSQARPCALEWIESIVTQCKAASVPVFVKQLGAFVVSEYRTASREFMQEAGYTLPMLEAPNGEIWAWRAGLKSKKGGDIGEFPDTIKVRQFPDMAAGVA